MSVVCQFHQYGHCKYGRNCEKSHTVDTCDSFPCPGIDKCSKRHPRVCQYFAVYGWCRFGAKCSFLHYSLSNSGHHTASGEVQEVLQTMGELREEVVTLKREVDRLCSENRHLLEMIEGLERDMRDEVGLEMEELDDEPEPSVEEYCDELGRLRYLSQQRLINILDGITAILEADKNGEAAGKIRKSGCLDIFGKLKKHSDAGISDRAQGILMRCEILQLYASGNGAGVPGGTGAPSPRTQGGRSKPRKR